jgi:predicted O-linked N-acetylglucosamine transferase (SPINDLY family)
MVITFLTPKRHFHNCDASALLLHLSLMVQAPWLDHLYTKTALDFMLDTSSKNGHTTGLDAVWAGVPTMSIGE